MNIEQFLRMNNCPNFRDPPVRDEDVDFILRCGWTLCDYQDICLEQNCPLLPENQTLPRLKDGKQNEIR